MGNSKRTNGTSAKQLLAYMKDTLTTQVKDLGTKVDTFSDRLTGRIDSLSVSVETLHKRVITYDEHSKHCDSKFMDTENKLTEYEQRFKRDFDALHDLESKLKALKTTAVIEEKAESKSKVKVNWVLGIAVVLLTLVTVWQGVERPTQVTKEDLKEVVKEVIKENGN